MAERKRPAKRARPTTGQVQAAAEGVAVPADQDGKVELLGQWFRMAEQVSVMAQLAFANAARNGIDSSDPAGMSAMYMLIRDCIDEAEWDRFERHAIATKADPEALMGVVAAVIVAHAARPTRPPGDSSTGRRRTSGRSRGSSSATAGGPGDGMVSVEELLAR